MANFMAKLRRVARTPKPGAKVRTWFSTNLEASAAYRKAKKSGGPINKDLKHDSDIATLKVTAAILGPALVGAGVIAGASIDGVNDSNTAKNLGIETGVAMASADAKSETGFQKEIKEEDISTDVEGLPRAFKKTYRNASVEAYNGYVAGYDQKTGQGNNEASSTLSLVSDGNSAEGETTTTENALEAMKAELKEKGRTDAYISGFDAGYSDTASQSESQTPEGTLEEQIESEQTETAIEQFIANNQSLLQILRGSELRINQIDSVVSVTFNYTSNGMGNVELIVKGSGNGNNFLSVSNIPVVTTSYDEAISSLQSNLSNTNKGESISPTIYESAVSIDSNMAGVKLTVNGQEVAAEDVYANIQIAKNKGQYNVERSAIVVTEDAIYKTEKTSSTAASRPSREDVLHGLVGYTPVVEEEMQ